MAELTNLGALFSLGRGGNATVYKSTFQGTSVVAEMMHKGFTSNDTLLFAKEAKLLGQLNHPSIVNLVGVCEDPIAIIMEYLEFSFRPFQRENSFYNLDELLSYK